MLGQVVVLVLEPGADDERLQGISLALQQEIRSGGSVSVSRLTDGTAHPPGARGLDVESAGALLVSLDGSIAAAQSLFSRIRSWLRRGPSDREVEVTIGDRAIKLSAASDEQQAALVDAFLREAEGR